MTDLPEYHTTRALHESASSIVYRAIQQTDQQPVVLKLLKEPHPVPDKIAWFKREYEVLQALQMPGVVMAHELTLFNQHWGIVLEDFGGESLSRLELAGAIEVPEFLPLASRIADILGRVHQQRYIHKDINPHNIVLNPETQEVKLIDFGISTVLSHETQSFHNPNVLEGTLAYMSPEQTGRMNRAMDYRTDLYSLGVTFYELLTGQLPFEGDALELVHSHIAKQPVPPQELKPDIPPVLSEMILKLMAKNADDRYQSAYGTKADLDRCLAANDRQTLYFDLGRDDVSDRFRLPQRLYGRDREIGALLDGFDDIRQGQRKLMLVSGYSGIGKSALVQELFRPITEQRGFFISGKFDQFQRNVPYASLIQAFRELMRQLLTESEAEIAVWREQLEAALGSNGQVLIDVIPELELIIGAQPAVPRLGPTESQNRFNLAFLNFIKVFAQERHPLVIFLDDLQWADGSTLNLLQVLITDFTTRHLLVLGAYRDNEVSPSHPLMLTLSEIEQTATPMGQIELEGLAVSDVGELLADTLHCPVEQVGELAELVMRKTAGNPFFVSQFLSYLYEDGLFVFSLEQGQWQWELERIAEQEITDNVVELMAGKLRTLPAATQEMLQFAACIGNQFVLGGLATVSERTPQQVAEAIWPALQEGLIYPLDEAYKLVEIDDQLASGVPYKFLHDRVQQAAYSLIDEDARPALHLKIGRLMWQRRDAAEIGDELFDVVNQLNVGTAMITEADEQMAAARLNLRAAEKAKEAIAYEAAAQYAGAGLTLLPPDSWQTGYDVSLNLHVIRAECAYLMGQFETAEADFDTALEHAQGTLDKVEIYLRRVDLYTAQSNYVEALTLGTMALGLLGVDLPAYTEEIDITDEFTLLQTTLGDRDIADLANLPTMTDEEKNYAMGFLYRLIPACYYLNQSLFALIVLRSVNLSLTYGNCPYSSYAYATYSIILCTGMQQFEAAYQFGLVAFDVDEQFEKNDSYHRSYQCLGTFVGNFKHHAKNNLDYLRIGYQHAVENGDITYAGYCGIVLVANLHVLGHPLDDVHAQSQPYLDFARRTNTQDNVNHLVASQMAILNLQGQTETPTSYESDLYDEAEQIKLMDASMMRVPLNWHAILKARSLYLFEDYLGALEMVQKSAELLPLGTTGLIQETEHYFYYSLILAALYPDAGKDDQAAYWDLMTQHQERMRTWADSAPENYEHKHLLAAAEMARLSGDLLTAFDLYDQAIEAARLAGYTNNLALSNELAAKCYLAQGRLKAAQPYLRDAHYHYTEWGATGKVSHLEQRYAYLSSGLEGSRSAFGDPHETASTQTQRVGALDLTSVLKASQAISGEIVLESLLSKMMGVIIENAGAEKGLLVLPRNGEWVIEAEAVINQEDMALPQSMLAAGDKTNGAAPPAASRLPMTVINYVARAQESVVLDDAPNDGAYVNDPYILAEQPKSILCAPLIQQGTLNGIVYLENNLTTDAFTPERLEVLNLLASQAAISIENATLYNTLEERVVERTAQLAERTEQLSAANIEITALNERLREENLRMQAELEITQRLQKMILPRASELAEVGDLDIAAYMAPADEVGGDYYDVLRYSGRVKVGVGDVTGHGLESGVVMLMTQTAVRTLLNSGETDPVRFMDILNRTLFENVERMAVDKHLTLMLLDYTPGELRISGQHEELIVVRRDGTVELIDTLELGFPIALDLDIAAFVAQTTVQLAPGDGVVLYTDGITEAENRAGEQYGLKRLCEIISQHWPNAAQAIQDAIIADIQQFIGDQTVYDDITLLVMKQK